MHLHTPYTRNAVLSCDFYVIFVDICKYMTIKIGFTGDITKGRLPAGFNQMQPSSLGKYLPRKTDFVWISFSFLRFAFPYIFRLTRPCWSPLNSFIGISINVNSDFQRKSCLRLTLLRTAYRIDFWLISMTTTDHSIKIGQYILYISFIYPIRLNISFS